MIDNKENDKMLARTHFRFYELEPEPIYQKKMARRRLHNVGSLLISIEKEAFQKLKILRNIQSTKFLRYNTEKNRSPRLQRCLLKVERHRYKIEYLKG